MIKSKGILFKAEMVTAILEGRKTQTRRLSNRYKLGDVLYVKETYAVMDQFGFDEKQISSIRYRQDPRTAKSLKFRSSMFMPRWASRITLEVTAVRCERLQDITEEDALAEGVDPYVPHVTGMLKNRYQELPTEAYRILWESINGAGSWAKNPWVWVYTFKRL